MTAAAAKKQRGFTLVELMIVLAVIGLILGGSLLTLGIQIRDGGRLDEQNQLERIREAVFAYALRHNTEFRYLQSVASPLLNYEIPAGRPYLPCPDIDGDGLEDRLPVDILRGTSPISTSATDPVGRLLPSNSFNRAAVWNTAAFCRGRHSACRPPTNGAIATLIGWIWRLRIPFLDSARKRAPTNLKLACRFARRMMQV